MPTAARRGPGSPPGSPSTTIAARTRRWPTERRWRSGAAAGNRLWTCRRAWTTLARCPHAHSHNRNNKQSWFNRSRKRRRLPPWETHPVASGTRTTAIGLARALGSGTRLNAAELVARAEAWRSWRAYAAMHLWMADRHAPAASVPHMENRNAFCDRQAEHNDRYAPSRL